MTSRSSLRRIGTSSSRTHWVRDRVRCQVVAEDERRRRACGSPGTLPGAHTSGPNPPGWDAPPTSSMAFPRRSPGKSRGGCPRGESSNPGDTRPTPASAHMARRLPCWRPDILLVPQPCGGMRDGGCPVPGARPTGRSTALAAHAPPPCQTWASCPREGPAGMKDPAIRGPVAPGKRINPPIDRRVTGPGPTHPGRV